MTMPTGDRLPLRRDRRSMSHEDHPARDRLRIPAQSRHCCRVRSRAVRELQRGADDALLRTVRRAAVERPSLLAPPVRRGAPRELRQFRRRPASQRDDADRAAGRTDGSIHAWGAVALHEAAGALRAPQRRIVPGRGRDARSHVRYAPPHLRLPVVEAGAHGRSAGG
jgi:hypothetical protein